MRVSLHVSGFLADFVALFLQKVYRTPPFSFQAASTSGTPPLGLVKFLKFAYREN